MASTDTRSLQLQISASAELLVRNLKQADNAVADFQQQTNARLTSIDQRFEALGALKGKLGGLGAGLIAAAGGASLIEVAKRGLEYASSLQEVSQQLGVTAKDLQTFRFAASQVGISQEEMDKGLSKLTQTMGKAAVGAREPAAAFKAIGVSIADLKGHTAGEVLPQIADGLAKIKDPAQRAAVEVALFGKAGQKLDTLLAGGSASLNELTDAAQRLGLVLSAEQIEKADNAADKLSAVKQVLEAKIAGVVADNANAILQLADALGTLIDRAGKAGGAYSGMIRIFQNEGIGGVARSFFNVDGRGGADQTASATSLGYFREKNAAFRSATVAFRGAANDPAASSARVVELRDAAVAAGTLARKAYQQYQGEAAGQIAAAKRARASLINADGGDASAFLTPKGPKGKSAEELAREAAAAAKRDRNEQRQAQDAENRERLELASQRADLANDPEQRLVIEKERVDLARDGKNADLELKALDNRYIAANLDRLKALNNDTAVIEKQLLERRRAQDSEQSEYERARAAQDDEIAVAEIRARLTLVARDRYAIERSILALRQKEEREALERTVANTTGRYTPEEVRNAADQLGRLPVKQAAEREQQGREQQGPLANYRAQLKSATGDMSEALQNVEVNGLHSLEDGLLGIVDGTESVASAFKKMAGSIIADLARIVIEKAILGALGGSFLGIKLADGGPVRLAGGGPVWGAGGPRDDRVPALLSHGEFVINAASTARYRPLVEAINSDRLPRFANGGAVSARLPSYAGAGYGANASRPVSFDLRGAVMTADLLQQMQTLAQQSGGQALIGAMAHTNQRFADTTRRRI